jgi:hypothetical protein
MTRPYARWPIPPQNLDPSPPLARSAPLTTRPLLTARLRMAHDTPLEVLHDADLLSAAVRAHVLEAVKHVGEARALHTDAAMGTALAVLVELRAVLQA